MFIITHTWKFLYEEGHPKFRPEWKDVEFDSHQFPESFLDHEIVIPDIYSEKFRYKFRIGDTENNIYFYGVATRNDSFGPLDLYGKPHGCTWIEYLNDNNEWKVLAWRSEWEVL